MESNIAPAEVNASEKKFSKTELQVAELVNRFEKNDKMKKNPCFFLSTADLHKLMNIPAFYGISIYNGLSDEGENVLVLVPVFKNSPPQNVYEQGVVIDGTPQILNTTVTLKEGPCPPYRPGCNSCTNCQ